MVVNHAETGNNSVKADLPSQDDIAYATIDFMRLAMPEEDFKTIERYLMRGLFTTKMVDDIPYIKVQEVRRTLHNIKNPDNPILVEV